MAATKKMPIYEKFAGLRNDIPDERLTPVDLAFANNVDLDDSGQLRRRPGYEKTVEGTDLHSAWSNYEQTLALYVDGTSLYRFDGVSGTLLGEGLTPGMRMAYAEHDGRVYHSNGMQCGIYEDGAVRSWGIRPPAGLALSPTAGAIEEGTYQLVTTFVANDGQESGCNAATSITLEQMSGLLVTLDVSQDPRVTTTRIYMTAKNGEALYWAGDVPNGTTTITIAAGHETLDRPLQTQFYGPPPKGSHLAYFSGRMYVAVDNELHFSAPFGLELFKPADQVTFDSPILMIAPTLDGLYVSDSKAVYWLAGTDPEQFIVRKVHDLPAIVGTLAFAQASRVANLTGEYPVPLWMAGDGVCVGAPSGQHQVLNDKYRFEAPKAGAAAFRKQRESFQYLASFLGG